mmetsp:Transcript_119645/g.338711  ORF Transcript_119645/g.338711 Transcript_119645/m.338711 type:complete len:307 (-) Transcript_119645:1158-2078(-)
MQFGGTSEFCWNSMPNSVNCAATPSPCAEGGATKERFSNHATRQEPSARMPATTPVGSHSTPLMTALAVNASKSNALSCDVWLDSAWLGPNCLATSDQNEALLDSSRPPTASKQAAAHAMRAASASGMPFASAASTSNASKKPASRTPVAAQAQAIWANSFACKELARAIATVCKAFKKSARIPKSVFATAMAIVICANLEGTSSPRRSPRAAATIGGHSTVAPGASARLKQSSRARASAERAACTEAATLAPRAFAAAATFSRTSAASGRASDMLAAQAMANSRSAFVSSAMSCGSRRNTARPAV